jgi:hypothetical protein
MAAKNLPKVFFDVAVNGKPTGRMTFKVKNNNLNTRVFFFFFFI